MIRLQRADGVIYEHYSEPGGPFMTKQMDAFTLAYLEAALATSHDESDEAGGDSLDQKYGIEDFAPEALEILLEDCERFQHSPAWLAATEAEEDPRTDDRQAHGYTLEASAGHDFWLTQNGHGAGFWDGDWAEPHASALDELSTSFGEVSLYLGDDGKIYEMRG